MALSDDQRAMLRLLAQREQGYEDMAALMGVSVEELRGRVKVALSELEKEGEEAPQLPPEPPKAEPEPPKAAPEPPKPSPPAVPAPPVAAEPPELSATPPSGQVPPAQPPKAKGPSPLKSKGALIGIGAVLAAAVIVVVLLVALGGGDGDSDSTSTTAGGTGSTTASAEAPAGGGIVAEATEAAETGSDGKGLTKALLSAEDGSDASGIAVFGRVKNKLALQVVAEGLEPLEAGEAYAIWIAASPTRMLPLATSKVSAKGELGSQLEVPAELLVYLAQGTFDEIAVTRASESELQEGLKAATKAKQPPAYTGDRVLGGKITGRIIGAAKRIEEKEAAEGK